MGNLETRRPARLADLRSDVGVPLAQAAVTGVAIGAVVGGLAGSVAAGLAASGGTFTATWLLLLRDHRRALWAVERIINQDLDHNGVVGEPPPALPVVRVELAQRNNGAESWRWLELPIDERKLGAVALAVRDGAPFSRRGLAEVLSQTDYERLAAKMLSAGLLHDVGSNRRVLSAAGRALMRRVVVAGGGWWTGGENQHTETVGKGEG